MKTYKPSKLPIINRPIVYGWRRKDQYLYIGKSRKGTSRIVDGKVLRFHVEEGDVVDIWKANLKNVDDLEVHFIRKFNPKYNITYTTNPATFDLEGNQICTLCKTKIKQRSNQRFCTSKCRIKYWKQHETLSPEKMKQYKELYIKLDKMFRV